MKKRFLIGSIVGISILLLSGCSSNEPITEQTVNNEVNQNTSLDTQFDDLFDANLSSLIESDMNNSQEDNIKEESTSSTVLENETGNNITDTNISSPEIDALEMKFIGCKKDNFIVNEADIRKAEDIVEPYDVFVMSFYYDEKPRLGFISPSGKTYYIECIEEIKGNNGEFSVYASDDWCTIALPGEVGEWTLYCDKKGNEIIEYNIQEIMIEEIEESNVDYDTQNTDITLSNFS